MPRRLDGRYRSMETVRERGAPQERPGISILSHDLSLNCAARAVLLADLLRRRYDVDVCGPRFGPDVWQPCADVVEAAAAPPAGRFPGFCKTMAQLRMRTEGSILYAQKPRFGSLGVALDAARRRAARGDVPRPVLLDIDDDELGLFENHGAGGLRDLASLINPNGRAWTRRLARRIGDVDAITAGSPALARRYGATFIPYAVDADHMDPSRFDGAAERARLGLPQQFVVLFCGSPKPHKGLDILARAIGRSTAEAHLHVIAPPFDDAVRESLRSAARDRVTFQGPVARRDLPRHLATADAVVIPQRDTPVGRMQTPAKLFDAMASGRAIIATRVGDIAEILDDCGIVVEPEDPDALVRAIDGLANNSGLAADLGRRARRRHQLCFDAEGISRRLVDVVETACERVSSPLGVPAR